MIVVDSSVLIDGLRDRRTREVLLFRTVPEPERILIGDLVLLEVPQGARDDARAGAIERELAKFGVVPMVGADVAIRAATHFRVLRGLGITIRKTVDLLIGTYCILGGHELLHADRDFDPMERHLGLRVA